MADNDESPLNGGEKKKQPSVSGENVKITKNPIDRDLVFYYSRERRLSRASAAVQELNNENTPPPRLTSRLFGSRNNFVIFITVIIICAAFGLGSRFTGTERSARLGRNNLAVEIQNEEGILILDITKNAPKSGEAYTGAIDIVVSPVIPKSKESGELPPLFTHRIFFTPRISEIFRISLPFDGKDFLVLLRIDSDQKALKLRAAGNNENQEKHKVK